MSVTNMMILGIILVACCISNMSVALNSTSLNKHHIDYCLINSTETCQHKSRIEIIQYNCFTKVMKNFRNKAKTIYSQMKSIGNCNVDAAKVDFTKYEEHEVFDVISAYLKTYATQINQNLQQNKTRSENASVEKIVSLTDKIITKAIFAEDFQKSLNRVCGYEEKKGKTWIKEVKQEGYFKEVVNKCKSKAILIKKIIIDFDYTLEKILHRLQPTFLKGGKK